MSEYLRFQPDQSKYPEASLSFQDLISTGQILAPAFLGLMLSQAKNYLIETPGEHQDQRKYLVPKWLDYWLNLMPQLNGYSKDNSKALVPHPNIVSLGAMAEVFRKSRKYTGIWIMATGEGSPAHRQILDESKSRVAQVGLLFEAQKYFTQHPGRRLPCLPEAVRASMAAHFGLLVSVAPDRLDAVSEDDHYQKVFKLSGANINFTTTENLHWPQVLDRNPENLRHLALIPPIVMHTSEMAKKLINDDLYEDDVFLTSHTSDLTDRLLDLSSVLVDLHTSLEPQFTTIEETVIK